MITPIVYARLLLAFLILSCPSSFAFADDDPTFDLFGLTLSMNRDEALNYLRQHYVIEKEEEQRAPYRVPDTKSEFAYKKKIVLEAYLASYKITAHSTGNDALGVASTDVWRILLDPKDPMLVVGFIRTSHIDPPNTLGALSQTFISKFGKPSDIDRNQTNSPYEEYEIRQVWARNYSYFDEDLGGTITKSVFLQIPNAPENGCRLLFRNMPSSDPEFFLDTLQSIPENCRDFLGLDYVLQEKVTSFVAVLFDSKRASDAQRKALGQVVEKQRDQNDSLASKDVQSGTSTSKEKDRVDFFGKKIALNCSGGSPRWVPFTLIIDDNRWGIPAPNDGWYLLGIIDRKSPNVLNLNNTFGKLDKDWPFDFISFSLDNRELHPAKYSAHVPLGGYSSLSMTCRDADPKDFRSVTFPKLTNEPVEPPRQASEDSSLSFYVFLGLLLFVGCGAAMGLLRSEKQNARAEAIAALEAENTELRRKILEVREKIERLDSGKAT